MRTPRFSLRKFIMFTVTVACLIGFSTHRIRTSQSGRQATYQIWALDGKTAGYNARVFVSPNSEINRISLTMNHGVLADLIGFDHTAAIIFPENEYNTPIDAEWLKRFETALVKLPRLKAVLIERSDMTDNMLDDLTKRFSNIQFERTAPN